MIANCVIPTCCMLAVTFAMECLAAATTVCTSTSTVPVSPFSLAPPGAGKMSRKSNCQLSTATRGTSAPQIPRRTSGAISTPTLRSLRPSWSPSLDRSVSAEAPRMNEIPFPLSLSYIGNFCFFFSLLVLLGRVADWMNGCLFRFPVLKIHTTAQLTFRFWCLSLLSVSLITYQPYFTLPWYQDGATPRGELTEQRPSTAP